jgi:threonine/homoserine/homoserine lactone efflux protein
MTFSTWLLFAITEGALCFVPGPAVLLVIAQGLAQGGRTSIWANLGILTGNTIILRCRLRASARCCSPPTRCFS